MCGLLGRLYALWHGTEVGVLMSFQIVQLVLGYAYPLHNLDLEYNFHKKRTLTLKSLLKCLNVGMKPFVLIFSINTVLPLDPSSFFKIVLYVAKTLYNKLCDLISASHPLVCSALEAAVLGQGLYSVGLCLDHLGLEAMGQLRRALDLTVKTAPALEPSN